MSVIVYALTNPAMPGLVKIGKTSRDDPQARMKELYNSSGVPLPFECVIAVEVEDDPDGGLEKAIHTAFAPYRLNPSREFFQIKPLQVEALLKEWPGKDVTPQVNKEAEKELNAGDREAVKRYKGRRPNLNFHEMGMPDGTVLVSAKTGKKATVTGERKVSFSGEEMTPAKATRLALGLDPSASIRPALHWKYKGRLLQEIYDETYESLIDPFQVEAPLKAWPGEDVTPQVNKEAEKELNAGDREAVKRYKGRRPNLNFHEMGMPDGTVLVSAKTGKKATVTGERKVSFSGEEMTPAKATRLALGLDPSASIRPALHWKYKGRLLKEIYDETYESLEE